MKREEQAPQNMASISFEGEQSGRRKLNSISQHSTVLTAPDWAWPGTQPVQGCALPWGPSLGAWFHASLVHPSHAAAAVVGAPGPSLSVQFRGQRAAVGGPQSAAQLPFHSHCYGNCFWRQP